MTHSRFCSAILRDTTRFIRSIVDFLSLSTAPVPSPGHHNNDADSIRRPSPLPRYRYRAKLKVHSAMPPPVAYSDNDKCAFASIREERDDATRALTNEQRSENVSRSYAGEEYRCHWPRERRHSRLDAAKAYGDPSGP